MLTKVDSFSRASVEQDTGRIYLFGDNIEDMFSDFVPRATQAVIRGLPNAIGIPTKKDRLTLQKSFFENNDLDFASFKHYTDAAIDRAKALGTEFVISAAGIGTGHATLFGAFADPESRFHKYLQQKLK